MNKPVRINVARGLASLVDQAMNRIALRLPAAAPACAGLGDVIKQAIDEHPSIPKEDLSALDLARHVGLVEPKRKRGRLR